LELLGEDPRGALYGGYLFPVEHAMQLVPALRAGRLGSSFRFRVVREDFQARPPKSPHNPERLPERTIGETHVSEFGPVVPGLLEHVNRRQDVIAGRRDSTAARHARGVPRHAPAAVMALDWSPAHRVGPLANRRRGRPALRPGPTTVRRLSGRLARGDGG